MKETETNTNKFDFILDNMGFLDEPLEQRAFVFCKILRELNIPFKKYYTSSQHRYLRSQPNNSSNVGIVIISDCDENHARYALYLFEKKMEIISHLNKML